MDLHGSARSVALTSIEFRLLQSLVKRCRARCRPGSVLLSEHWEEYAIDGVALVRVYIRNLRAKKEAARRDPGLIRIEWVLGYLLVSNDESDGLSM